MCVLFCSEKHYLTFSIRLFHIRPYDTIPGRTGLKASHVLRCISFNQNLSIGLKVKNEKRLRKSGSLYAQDKTKIRQNDEDEFGQKNIQ